MDLDRTCPHEDFLAYVEINRLTGSDNPGAPATAFYANITVFCSSCGEKFRWIGAEAGLSPARPMVSVDETELRAPMRPASEDPDFGLGNPGYAVRYRET